MYKLWVKPFSFLVFILAISLSLTSLSVQANDIKQLQQRAEQGDVEAQFILGKMYYWEEGVKQDYFQAVQWWRKAAEQGYAKAQHNLGVMYYDGEGVKQDYFQAVQWWRKAAEQGAARAQNSLGVMYRYGKGVRQNLSQAKEWFGKACDNGEQVGCDNYRELNNQ